MKSLSSKESSKFISLLWYLVILIFNCNKFFSAHLDVTLTMNTFCSWNREFIFREFFKMNEWMMEQIFQPNVQQIVLLNLGQDMFINNLYGYQAEVTIITVVLLFSPDHSYAKLQTFPLTISPLTKGVQHKFYRQCVKPMSCFSPLVLFWNSISRPFSQNQIWIFCFIKVYSLKLQQK